MTIEEKMEARKNGATYQQIADVCGTSRQAVHNSVRWYKKKLEKEKRGIRGKGFNLSTIKYKGIYEYFKKNKAETVTSFTKAVCGHGTTTKMSIFLKGETDAYFTVSQIKKMCEICGKPFEEVFAERTPTEKGGGEK